MFFFESLPHTTVSAFDVCKIKEAPSDDRDEFGRRRNPHKTESRLCQVGKFFFVEILKYIKSFSVCMHLKFFMCVKIS